MPYNSNSNYYDNSYGGGWGNSGYGGMNSFSGGYTGNVDFSNPTGTSVLGNFIDLPPALAPVVQGLQSFLNGGGSIEARKYITKNGEKLAARFLDNEAHQHTAAAIAANVAEKTLLLYDPAIGFVMNLRNHHKQDSAMAGELTPYLEGHHYRAGSFGLHRAAKHNEVLADALAATSEQSKNQLTSIALSAAMAVPNIIINNKDMQLAEADEKMQLKAEQFHQLKKAANENPEISAKLRQQAEEMIATGKLKFSHYNERLEPEHLLLEHQETQLEEEKRALEKEISIKAQNLQKIRYQYLPTITGIASAATQPLLEKGQKISNKGVVLAMIGHLSEQLRVDPNADEIEMKEGEPPVKLADFVREIFVTHQKVRGEPGISKHNMPALKKACEAIAGEIQARRLDPLALIDLVGERQIVGCGGKTLAGDTKVLDLISKAKKMLPVQAVDLRQYENDSILSHAEKKDILDHLKGLPRALFVASNPPEEMEKFGVKMAEIQQAHEATADRYDENMAKALLFITRSSDRALRDEGYDGDDVRRLRDGASLVKTQGSAGFGEQLGHPGDSAGLIDLIADNKRLWQNLDKALAAPLPTIAPQAADENRFHSGDASFSRSRPAANDQDYPIAKAAANENRLQSIDPSFSPRSRLAANDDTYPGTQYLGTQATMERSLAGS